MEEIVKVENVGYARYEELLLRREKLKKEAFLLMEQFMREFGDLITAVFQKKIDCIQKKKMIGYCLTAINCGTAIDISAMQAYIQKEMEEYQEQLQQLIEENEAAHQMFSIPAADMAKIKKLYRKLAKILHPDINPKTSEIPELLQLWYLVSDAYQYNDLEALEEAEILVNRALKEHNLADLKIEIPNLEEKIAEVEKEIAEIKNTDPYQYKFLLDDAELVEEKRTSLQEELKQYEEYDEVLDSTLAKIMKKEGNTQWQMN